MTERIVNADRVEDIIAVFGSFDENIKRIEEALFVTIVNRGTDLRITGDPESVDKAARALDGLLALAAKGEVIDEQRVRYLITLVQEGNEEYVSQKDLGNPPAADLNSISADSFLSINSSTNVDNSK